ncbi:5-aminolevulinate synthase [Streptomyces sp. NEAU-sy36]|uniref:5-aminolevulinate synthase n=1 Tax=unclassified Streptomyces TaxID=2593676 RepID=UPI0015D591C5|nr:MULTISPECIES: 5-aminolevulinate synthase [unclassified Streptomyces]QLJ00584.1 5-aminolevulinate synthase [Streptomyces sp. NEAU-sy36]
MTTASLLSRSALDTLRQDLDELRDSGLYREFVPCSYLADKPGHALHQGREIQVWCTNDYLGMSQHPEVIQAQIDSTRRHGTGNGGSRNIAGTSEAHVELEASLAAWHGKERALVFNSGYIANLETLSTLIVAIPDVVVFSDALNHRSLIEGIRRTGAEKRVFPHNDLVALEAELALCDAARPKLIVFESVYSMDGDYAPVREICDLAERYNAFTYLDETHAIGVNGPSGAGLCEEIGEDRATFVQGVFGKAVGTTGGYVAGPDIALDYVRSHAPGFIFTTTIPRSSLDATLASLRVIREDEGLRRDLRTNAARMKKALSEAGIAFIDAPSHLVPVLVPGGTRIRRVARRLLDEYGIYVQPVNFPSVPKGGERFRVTTAPFRTQQQIDDFVRALRACLDQD